MTRDDAFIELLATGVEPEEAKILIDAVARDHRPTHPEKPVPGPIRHQPVWALMNRPFGIVTGFRQMYASEASDTFDFGAWEGSMR